MLGAADIDAGQLAALAKEEDCASIVSYIAQCGHRYEPENQFWSELISQIGDVPPPPEEQRLHPTRFVEMTGIIRGKVGTFTSWVRPTTVSAS